MTMRMGLDYESDNRLAFAAGWDAGDRAMRRAGRTLWNADDRDAANTLWGGLLDAWGWTPDRIAASRDERARRRARMH